MTSGSKAKGYDVKVKGYDVKVKDDVRVEDYDVMTEDDVSPNPKPSLNPNPIGL